MFTRSLFHTVQRVGRQSALNNLVTRVHVRQFSSIGDIVRLPAMSPTMEDGEITRWIKKEGESFAVGDVLFEVETDKATLEVEATDDGVLAKILLHHLDRVLWGNNHLYIFHHPDERKKAEEEGKELPKVDWDFVQHERAKAAGLSEDDAKAMGQMTQEELDRKFLNDDIMTAHPLIVEANAISQELNKGMFFELKLANEGGKSVVTIKVTDLITDNVFIWTLKKFVNRAHIMREMYQNIQEYGDEAPPVPEDQDPFFDPAQETVIGSVMMPLSSLCHMIETEESLTVRDDGTTVCGSLKVAVHPCTKDGSVDEFDDFCENPEDLVGKDLHFLLEVEHGRGFPDKFKSGIFLRFHLLHQEPALSSVVAGTLNPEFKFKQQYSYTPVTKEIQSYLEGDLTIECMGVMEDRPKDAMNGLDTVELLTYHQKGEVHPKVKELRKGLKRATISSPATVSGLGNSSSALQTKIGTLEKRLNDSHRIANEAIAFIEAAQKDGTATGDWAAKTIALLKTVPSVTVSTIGSPRGPASPSPLRATPAADTQKPSATPAATPAAAPAAAEAKSAEPATAPAAEAKPAETPAAS